MRIDLWSDFACPFCWIGEARLERAIRDLGAERDIVVVMRSFELDPTAPKRPEGATVARFAAKYGLTPEAAAERVEDICRMGRDEGLDFRYATARYSNMLNAHCLAKHAEAAGIADIHKRLFAAYFTDNLDLADHAVLAGIARAAGLSEEDISAALDSDLLTDAVRADEAEAARLGIHSVPFFLITPSDRPEQRYAISGAQPTERLRQALAHLLAEERGDVARRPVQSGEQPAAACGPEGCAIG